MVEGTQLAQALVSLKDNHLRFVYVMMKDLNVWELVSSKTKDMVSKEQSDHFYKWMEKEAEELKGQEAEELQLDLLLQLSQTLKLPGRSFKDAYEIEKQCQDLIEELFAQMQKQYKDFKETYEQSFNKNKLEFIIHWEMKEMYRHLIEEQSKRDHSSAFWVEEIVGFIQDLPGYYQEQLMQSLDMAAMTGIELEQAIKDYGLFFLFTEITDRTGFEFYKYLLQSFNKNEESQPPEEMAYFSWMTNPNLLLSLILKGGTVLYRYQNLLYNKGLIPIVIMQTALPYLTEEEKNADLNRLSNTWSHRLELYRSHLRTVNELVKKQNDWQKGLALLQEELVSNETALHQTESYHKQLNEKLKQMLKHDPHRPYFGDLSVRNNRLQEKLDKINEKLEDESDKKQGMLKAVSGFIKSSYLQSEKAQLEKKIDKIFSEIAALVLEKYPDYNSEVTGEIYRSKHQLEEITHQQEEIKHKIEKFQEALLKAKTEEKEERKKIELAEKRTYGLKDVYGVEIGKEINHLHH
ncbi:hypothetical protein JOC78_003111 [Bacillus ectoiniformans]|uniref:hypothetical protein n=1 Tax=Bacillus ectoiniformans TaxID=1494429 RepID=UPI0019562C73|nr:hypothetical protein [Bacillus ectoiniformans]MBM7650127.1 hypothetical protein [Bacillus ectoiniformans]